MSEDEDDTIETEVIECDECNATIAKRVINTADITPEKVEEQVIKMAPEGKEVETAETLKGGLSWAAIGGILGAPFGPAGVIAGISLGGAGGGFIAKEGKLQVQCENCGGTQLVSDKFVDDEGT